MKKILILIALIAIVAIGGTIISSRNYWEKKAKTEVKDDFLSIPDYSSTDNSVKTVASPPKPIDTGDVSYWFVVVQKQNGVMMNTIMQQNHKGFSLDEAKAELGGKESFILNFIQVSKETWDINN